MNLNTFARHGVFEDKRFAQAVAERLKDEREIARAKVFPYQLMVAYTRRADAARTAAPHGTGLTGRRVLTPILPLGMA